MLQFRFDAISDTGRVRDNNEDSGFAGPYLVCVADGVGGQAAGEVASATASYVLSAEALAYPGRDPLRILQLSLDAAHDQLVAGVASAPARTGMATTVTAVLTDGVRFGLLHLGDSRGYLLRGGSLSPLTRDHTLVRSLVDTGRLTPAQAAASPYRHVVLKALDATTPPEPDLTWLSLQVGDRVLLCTDGLTDVLDAAQIATLLALPRRADATTALVRAALDAESRDNVTAIIADVVDAPAIVGNGVVLGAGIDLGNVVDPACVRPLRTA